MADYLKSFATQADYDAYIASDYPKPNVSYIEATDETIFTNYEDGPATADTVITGMKIADFTGTTFNGSNNYITEAYVPEGVTSIANYAFQNNSGLTKVELPSTIKTIGAGSFSGCTSLGEIEIPEGVTILTGGATSGFGLFYNCTELTDITLPSTLDTIQPNVFTNCYKLSNLYISDLVAWCNITFSDLSGFPFTSVQNNVTTHLFVNGSEVTDLVIPSTITEIKANAFNRFKTLTSLSIHDGVTNIRKSAFSGCSSLASVTVRATTPPTLGTYVFNNTPANLVIYVPAESVEAYKAATNWSTYASQIQAIQ